MEIVGIGVIEPKMYYAMIHTIQKVCNIYGLKKILLSLGQLYDACSRRIIKIVKGVLTVIKANKIIAILYMLLVKSLQKTGAFVKQLMLENSI